MFYIITFEKWLLPNDRNVSIDNEYFEELSDGNLKINKSYDITISRAENDRGDIRFAQ